MNLKELTVYRIQENFPALPIFILDIERKINAISKINLYLLIFPIFCELKHF